MAAGLGAKHRRYEDVVPALLAGKFRRVGPADFFLPPHHRVDCLETKPLIRLQDLGDRCVSYPGPGDLPYRQSRETGAMGMGQHQGYRLGLLPYPAVSLDRPFGAMADLAARFGLRRSV